MKKNKKEIRFNKKLVSRIIIIFILILLSISPELSLNLGLIDSFTVYKLQKPLGEITIIAFMALVITIFISLLKHVFYYHEKKR